MIQNATLISSKQQSNSKALKGLDHHREITAFGRNMFYHVF